jgi:hypothetical protein
MPHPPWRQFQTAQWTKRRTRRRLPACRSAFRSPGRAAQRFAGAILHSPAVPGKPFHVVSSAGAQGIAQFMPETAADEGLDNPFDPLQAIPASARLLKKLFEQFGNLGLAAAAYNAGPKTNEDWLAKKGKLPEETQGYVKTVTGRPAETWRVAKAGGTALSLPPRAPCKEAVPAAQTVTASNAPHDSHKRAKLAHRV